MWAFPEFGYRWFCMITPLSNLVTNLNYFCQLPATFFNGHFSEFLLSAYFSQCTVRMRDGERADRIKGTISDLRSNDMLGDGVCVHRIKLIVKISKHGWEKDINLYWGGQRSITEKLRGFFLFKVWYIEKIWLLLSRAE